MPTTRRQSAIAEGRIKIDEQRSSLTTRKGRHPSKGVKHDQSGHGGDSEMKEGVAVGLKQGKKREIEQAGGDFNADDKEPLSKKSRFESDSEDRRGAEDEQQVFKPGLCFRPLYKARN